MQLARNAFCNKTMNRTAFINGLEQDTSTKLTGFTVTKDTNSLITRGCQRRLLVCSKLITKQQATESAVRRLIQRPGYHDNKFDNEQPFYYIIYNHFYCPLARNALCNQVRHTAVNGCQCPLKHGLKGKGVPYSLPSVGPGADPGVQAVGPQVTQVIYPAVGCQYFTSGLRLPSQP